jgi:ABC-type transport system involved in multi-copper enzyme maturation permease subunit
MQIKINPVFRKELKLTTRSWKIAITILLYTGVLAAIGILVFDQLMQSFALRMSYQDFTTLYVLLSALQFGLILFVVPALTAGAISGERERQTLEIILSTPLKPFSILIGKLLSSLSTVVLLVVASLPILSLIFVFGGVSMIQLLGLIGYYIVTAIFVGSIGVFLSTIFKKTTVSNVMAYGTVVFLTLGTFIFIVLYYTLVSRYNYSGTPVEPPLVRYILYLNPLTGFISIMMQQLGSMASFGIYFNIAETMNETLRNSIIIQLVVSVVLLLIASRSLNPKKARFVVRKRDKKIKAA